jgi:hypothetical protein
MSSRAVRDDCELKLFRGRIGLQTRKRILFFDLDLESFGDLLGTRLVTGASGEKHRPTKSKCNKNTKRKASHVSPLERIIHPKKSEN